jgi:hypothetical protein
MSKAAALEVAFREHGAYGNNTHITMEEKGTIPIEVVANMLGQSGEIPGDHRNMKGEEWEEFKADLTANGMHYGIFIVVEVGEPIRVWEGNHRRDAAVELGWDEIPVQIRYFGHAEQDGTLMERWERGGIRAFGRKIGPWYHASDHDLPIGTTLLPGGDGHKAHGDSRPDRVYFSNDPWVAISHWPATQFVDGVAALYEVQPNGEIEDDANFLPGWEGESHCAPSATIVRRVPYEEIRAGTVPGMGKHFVRKANFTDYSPEDLDEHGHTKIPEGILTIYRAIVLDIDWNLPDGERIRRVLDGMRDRKASDRWSHWTWDLEWAKWFADNLADSNHEPGKFTYGPQVSDDGYEFEGDNNRTRIVIEADIDWDLVERDHKVVEWLRHGMDIPEPELLLKPGARITVRAVWMGKAWHKNGKDWTRYPTGAMRVVANVDDYGSSHQPPDDGAPLHDLIGQFPDDVYDRPDLYDHTGGTSLADRDSARAIRRYRGKPNDSVTIYRAVPPGVTEIETGNWVTLSEQYALDHSYQFGDDVGHWPILSASVPAHTIRNGGNDIVEWGYWGPPITNARKVAASGWSTRMKELNQRAEEQMRKHPGMGDLRPKPIPREMTLYRGVPMSKDLYDRVQVHMQRWRDRKAQGDTDNWYQSPEAKDAARMVVDHFISNGHPKGDFTLGRHWSRKEVIASTFSRHYSSDDINSIVFEATVDEAYEDPQWHNTDGKLRIYEGEVNLYAGSLVGIKAVHINGARIELPSRIAARASKTASAFQPAIVASWESSRPWDAPRADLEAQRVPGFRVGNARGTESASFEGGFIVLKEQWFTYPTDARRAICYHEAGHGLETKAGYDEIASAFGVGNVLDIIDLPGAQRFGYNPDEIVAQAYSVLWTEPQWASFDGGSEILAAVARLAQTHGYPLPTGAKTAAAAPAFLYHGTKKANVPSILREGIRPTKAWHGEGDAWVYLASSLSAVVEATGSGSSPVFLIDTRGLDIEDSPAALSNDAWRTRGHIPVSNIVGVRWFDCKLEDGSYLYALRVAAPGRPVYEGPWRAYDSEEQYDIEGVIRRYASGAHTASATAGPIYRGFQVKLPDDLLAKIRELARPPTTMEEKGRDRKIGRLVVDWLQSNHWDGDWGLGRHWTTSKQFATAAAMQGGTYGGIGILLTATYDPSGQQTELDQDEKRWAKSESEIRLLPGAKVAVTNVEFVNFYALDPKWVTTMDGPIQATASTTTYYHGTMADLPPGTILVPGGEKARMRGDTYVHFSTDLSTAFVFAGANGDVGHVYEVEPIGEVQAWRFNEFSFRAPQARIVREVSVPESSREYVNPRWGTRVGAVGPDYYRLVEETLAESKVKGTSDFGSTAEAQQYVRSIVPDVDVTVKVTHEGPNGEMKLGAKAWVYQRGGRWFMSLRPEHATKANALHEIAHIIDVERNGYPERGGEGIDLEQTWAHGPLFQEVLAELQERTAKVGDLRTIKREDGKRRLSDAQVLKRCREVVDAVGREHGVDLSGVEVEINVDYLPSGVEARYIAEGRDARTTTSRILISTFLTEDMKHPETGVQSFRQLAHEATHAVSDQLFIYEGHTQDFEEGATEILSVWHWAKEGQPFGHNDAFRDDGKWVDGIRALVHRANYHDLIAGVLRRAASKVGWQPATMIAYIRATYGNYREVLGFMQDNDANFPPPAGVRPDGESLLLWLVTEGIKRGASRTASFDVDQIREHLADLDLPSPARDGDCIWVSGAVAKALKDHGIDAEVEQVTGWDYLMGHRVVVFAHMAVRVGDTIVDASATQYDASLPSVWVIEADEYLNELAKATGVMQVTFGMSATGVNYDALARSEP